MAEGEFQYGNDSRVITQLQLEKRLKDGRLGEVNDVVMVNCVNSKNEKRGCCNIGCHISVAPELDSIMLLPEEYRVN